ncbi:hypothetical protein CYMTET_10881 [Cymbomonas tetramitiformis]|uniref:Uncharacterized protein n=1 Tax=Cymbomonas tetramitiformis TaxID=36881 RepID=A0AAE0LDQ6_9CHLO|nr:hypothetical protein CYMTET_10881 [Cymbomonas tetramitiformis]
MGEITTLNAISYPEDVKTRLKVHKNMAGLFVKFDGNRLAEVRRNTPVVLEHLYTTVTRSLNTPKLDSKKQVKCHDGALKAIAGITHLTKRLWGCAWCSFRCITLPEDLQALLLHGMHPASGCDALGKVLCEANKDTLVVGQKSISPCTYPVERYSGDPGQVVMDPFMGSGSCGVASYLDGTDAEEEYLPP